MPEFEWDEKKNTSNKEKHRIAFEDAKGVFDDKKRIQYIPPRNLYGERRWKTVGSLLNSITTVIYTVRNAVFRIISARRANKKEKRRYDYDEAKNIGKGSGR